MASVVEICNRALQKVGAQRIVSITDDNVRARACNAAYEVLRDGELRANVWNFSIARAELAEDATTPAWGRAAAYTLPADWLRMAPQYPEDNTVEPDWQIEGKKIITDDSAPIYLRYVYKVTDPNEMDVLFRELLAATLAIEICEELTQSNTKKDALKAERKEILAMAKRTNSIENVSVVSPDDGWLTCRE